MEEQELKNIWKNSSKTEDITINTSQLLSDFKVGMEDRERIVRKRDTKEIFFAILGIVGFIIIAIRMWFSIPSLGIIIITLTYVYYIFKLRSNRKSKYTQKLFVSFQEQLENQKQFMQNQAKLLNTILYWALIPFFIGYMVVIWSVWDLTSVNFSSFLSSIYPESLKSKIICTVFVLIAFFYTQWTNKKAAKVNWDPLIKQIDIILKNLKEEEK